MQIHVVFRCQLDLLAHLILLIIVFVHGEGLLGILLLRLQPGIGIAPDLFGGCDAILPLQEFALLIVGEQLILVRPRHPPILPFLLLLLLPLQVCHSSIKIEIIHDLILAQLLVEKEAMKEGLVALDVCGQKGVEALLSAALVENNLNFIRKNELCVLLHLNGVIVHREQNVGIQPRVQLVLVVAALAELLHEFLLGDAGDHEVFNEALRDLLARGGVLHF